MENYERAEQDYMGGMKYKDIAEKYGTTINTVKSWKKRYGWNRGEGAPKAEKVCTQKPKGAHKKGVPIDDGTKETLQNDDLTPEQQMFCIYYSRTFNATQSYLNAYGCSYNAANAEGYKLLVKPCIRKEIERLKEIKRQQIVAGTDDIVELQMRIAFADIGNYLSFGQREFTDPDTGIEHSISTVDLKESKNADTQIIQEVKQGRDGVSIKLADRQKAIAWLTMFFEMNPSDKHRKEFEQRKLELELIKLEMQTKDGEEDAPEQDNFLDALNDTAKKAWSDD